MPQVEVLQAQLAAQQEQLQAWAEEEQLRLQQQLFAVSDQALDSIEHCLSRGQCTFAVQKMQSASRAPSLQHPGQIPSPQPKLAPPEARLADAQQRFDREQAAAKEALRSFAPGFGAGKLLANAMARRTAQFTATGMVEQCEHACTAEREAALTWVKEQWGQIVSLQIAKWQCTLSVESSAVGPRAMMKQVMPDASSDNADSDWHSTDWEAHGLTSFCAAVQHHHSVLSIDKQVTQKIFIMLATTFRQVSRAAAGRALLSQSSTSIANLAPFASAAGQPSDPKTVLAILYKAGSASEEKRLLGARRLVRKPVAHGHACLAIWRALCSWRVLHVRCRNATLPDNLTTSDRNKCCYFVGCVENELGLREWLESQGHKYIVTVALEHVLPISLLADSKEGADSDLDKYLPEADVVITTPFHPGYISAERLAKANKLKLALTAGIGSDHVDLDAAAKNGVTVAEITGNHLDSRALLLHCIAHVHAFTGCEELCNRCLTCILAISVRTCRGYHMHATAMALMLAGSNVVSVAEHVVMMILTLVRNYMPAHKQIVDGDWNVAEIARNFLACTSAQMQSRLVQKHDMQIEVAAVVHVARAVAFSGLMLLSKAGNATAHATCTPAARPVWLKLAFAQLAFDLEDKVVGTVGAGRIGQRVLQRLAVRAWPDALHNLLHVLQITWRRICLTPIVVAYVAIL
ncbi:hypothetical protein MMC14_009961 [Varicellaria rhodocarpa]|nr:hypothetical protein [Varicellaria rhodocarpa]